MAQQVVEVDKDMDEDVGEEVVALVLVAFQTTPNGTSIVMTIIRHLTSNQTECLDRIFLTVSF